MNNTWRSASVEKYDSGAPGVPAQAMIKPPRESDLYAPVRDYLVRNGYTVRGEVKSCDITAVKGDDLIVVELKRHLSTDLLVQAVQRQKLTDSVYIAVPRNQEMGYGRKWRGLLHLLRRL